MRGQLVGRSDESIHDGLPDRWQAGVGGGAENLAPFWLLERKRPEEGDNDQRPQRISAQVEAFIEHDNHRRCHANLNIVTAADACSGRHAPSSNRGKG